MTSTLFSADILVDTASPCTRSPSLQRRPKEQVPLVSRLYNKTRIRHQQIVDHISIEWDWIRSHQCHNILYLYQSQQCKAEWQVYWKRVYRKRLVGITKQVHPESLWLVQHGNEKRYQQQEQQVVVCQHIQSKRRFISIITLL